MTQAVSQFTLNTSFNIPVTKVFVSVGGNDRIGSLPQMKNFRTSLENADYENIDLSWYIFDGKDHFSVLYGCTTRTINTLHSKK